MKSATCKNGHTWTTENTYLWPRGDGRFKRCCRACQRDRASVAYQVSRDYRATKRMEKIEKWKRNISPSELSWAAGHFEGDGYTRPLASLASTDREVIELFSAWWPTSIAGKKPRIPTPNARPVYRWEINSAVKVRAFIDQIRPYLRTERCRVKFDLVSEFTDKLLAPHKGKTRQRHPEYIASIRRLNHRGSAPFVLPSGKTFLEHAQAAKMLPAPKE